MKIEYVDGKWYLTIGDADPVECASEHEAIGRMVASDAYAALRGSLADVAAMDMGDGEGPEVEDGPATPMDPAAALRPETWRSGPDGIVQAAATGPERTFEGCTFSWRDTPLPLMVKMTASHGGMDDGCAMLAGFVTGITGRQDGGCDAVGTFLNNDAAEAAIQVMQGGGRFWCSVDPSENVSYEVECLAMDDDGWCDQARVRFTAYEIAGLTLVPFPGFAPCHIVLDGADALAASADDGGATGVPAVAEPLTAATPADPTATVAPVKPPAAWFAMAEPSLGGDDAHLLVRQPRRGSWDQEDRYAVPLTVTDDGQVFGHLAANGTCHIGYADRCITVPPSPSQYARFMLHTVETDDGSSVVVGPLVVGCDHALHTYRASQARDHYAHAALAWADVRVVDGVHGPWVCGALRPDVTVAQLRVIRGCALSGDWRDHGGDLDLIGAQLVNTPGFPIAREAVAASALEPVTASVGYRVERDRVVALTAAGIVHRTAEDEQALVASGVAEPCTDCAARRKAAAAAQAPAVDAALAALMDRMTTQLAAMAGLLSAVEVRTRHLRPAAADAAREALTRRLAGVHTLTVATGGNPALVNGTH